MANKCSSCSDCRPETCSHCRKIQLRVIGNDDSARALYSNVLAALDKLDVDASVVFSKDDSPELAEFAKPILVSDGNVLFSGRVPSVIEAVAMILMLGE